jgi:hypothetical protein
LNRQVEVFCAKFVGWFVRFTSSLCARNSSRNDEISPVNATRSSSHSFKRVSQLRRLDSPLQSKLPILFARKENMKTLKMKYGILYAIPFSACLEFRDIALRCVEAIVERRDLRAQFQLQIVRARVIL